jgi:hypothetical protein
VADPSDHLNRCGARITEEIVHIAARCRSGSRSGASCTRAVWLQEIQSDQVVEARCCWLLQGLREGERGEDKLAQLAKLIKRREPGNVVSVSSTGWRDPHHPAATI